MTVERRDRRIQSFPGINREREESCGKDETDCIVSNRLSTKSRMMGDYHVRFCERLGVKLPRSTRLPKWGFGGTCQDSFRRYLN